MTDKPEIIDEFDIPPEEMEKYFPAVGIQTFLRSRHTRDLEGAEVVVMGNPFDSGTSNRPGTRFGPRALREQSLQIYAYANVYPWGYDLHDELTIIDYGDVIAAALGAGATISMIEEMEKHSRKVYEAGASILVLGGDHTNPYGPMRAAAAKHGKLSMLHFDSHQDSSKTGVDHFHHGSFAWDMVNEGVVDASKSVQAYIRTYAPDQATVGYNIIHANDAMAMGPGALAAQMKKIVGDNPVYITFDIDCLDPVYAPGTGTPVCGGPTLHEVRTVLQGLKGINIVGADLVEVAPIYDGPGQITALAGATLATDFLYLMAEGKRVKTS